MCEFTFVPLDQNIKISLKSPYTQNKILITIKIYKIIMINKRIILINFNKII